MNIMDPKMLRKIDNLERKRNQIAQELDRSYLRDDMTGFIKLEEKYERLIAKIHKLQSKQPVI